MLLKKSKKEEKNEKHYCPNLCSVGSPFTCWLRNYRRAAKRFVIRSCKSNHSIIRNFRDN